MGAWEFITTAFHAPFSAAVITGRHIINTGLVYGIYKVGEAISTGVPIIKDLTKFPTVTLPKAATWFAKWGGGLAAVQEVGSLGYGLVTNHDDWTGCALTGLGAGGLGVLGAVAVVGTGGAALPFIAGGFLVGSITSRVLYYSNNGVGNWVDGMGNTVNSVFHGAHENNSPRYSIWSYLPSFSSNTTNTLPATSQTTQLAGNLAASSPTSGLLVPSVTPAVTKSLPQIPKLALA